MKITNVSLINFRNYKELNLDFKGNKFVFLGDNAQGKTNLLESLYYASTLRSFRSSNDYNLILFNQDFARVEITFEKNNLSHKLQIVISNDGKYLKLDNKVIKKYSDILGYLNTILFTPNDLKTFFTAPKERRYFIDLELGKISSSYLNNLLRFHALLKERNALLKLHKIDDLYLDVLTKEMIKYQVELIIARHTFLELLSVEANKKYHDITNEAGLFKINYATCINEFKDIELMNQLLLDKYHKNYEKEKEFGKTLISINHDDFQIYVDEISINEFGSQGQKRSSILALKLGLLEIIKLKTSEYPILLLDDVLSELDEKHRNNLINSIPTNTQVFITSTELLNHDLFKDTRFYNVSNGTIKED